MISVVSVLIVATLVSVGVMVACSKKRSAQPPTPSVPTDNSVVSYNDKYVQAKMSAGKKHSRNT